MKNFLLTLGVFFFVVGNISAQLVADAGPDTIACPGFITIGGNPTASGGIPPYTYSWGSDAGHGSTNLANPSYGIGGSLTFRFWVVVTDSLGAQATDTAVVTALPAATSLLLNVTNPTCVGQLTSFQAVTDGPPPYSYLWDFGDGTTSALENPQHAYATTGTFLSYLTLTDSTGCSSGAGEGILVDSCGQLVADAGPDVLACYNAFPTIGGSPTATGGTPPYYYYWTFASDSSLLFTDTTIANPDINPAIQTDTLFVLRVVDALGAEAFDTMVLTRYRPFVTVQASDTLVCTGDTVSFSATITDAFPPYTYVWYLTSGQSTDPTPEQVYYIPGVEGASVIVTDANGCDELGVYLDTIFVQTCGPLTADAGADTIICLGNSVVIGGSPTAEGGAPPYTYAWSPWNGEIDDTTAANPWIGPFGTGTLTYTLTVTDDLGAQAFDTVTVTVAPRPTVNAGPDQTVCIGNNITLGGNPTASGGIPPYTIVWSLQSVFPGNPTGANPSVTYAFAGTFRASVAVTAGGCTERDTAFITVLSSPNVSIAPPAMLTCAMTSVTLTASSATLGAIFQWSNGATTPAVTVTGAGVYSVTVTDPVNGCTASASRTVNQNTTPPNVSIAPPGALTCSFTSMTMAASSSTPGVTYDWGGGITTSTRTVSAAGVYSVTVTDPVNGCTASASRTVSQNTTPPNVSIAPPNTLTCLVTSVSLVASSTTPGVTYNWGGGVTSSTHTVSVAGTYSVTVTDPANGCSASSSTIVNYSCQGFGITSTNASCAGSCNGSAMVIPPPGNYNYIWNNSATTATVNNLCAGTYNVTVTDSLFNTIDSLWVVITEPAQLVASGFPADVTCFGGNNADWPVTVTGGTGAYTYTWSNGQTGPIATNLSAGNYSVTVMDANSCSVSLFETVIEPALLVATTTAIPESILGACDGSINLTVSGGVTPYSFTWSNSSNTEDLVNLCTGSWNVTVTDSYGCTTISNALVVTGTCTNNTLVVSIDSTGDIDCTNLADTLSAVVSGGTPPYNYLWTGPVSGSGPSLIASPGIYTLQVSDDSGCVRTAMNIVLNLGMTITLNSATPVSCNGVSNGKVKVTVNNGQAPYTFLWSNGATADSIVNVPAGNYTLTVTDAGVCSATFSYFLNQSTNNWSFYTYMSTTYANCSSNGTATVTPYGGIAPYTYLWNTTPPQTTATATGLSGGNYSVTVTGANGCTRTAYAYIYSQCYNVITGRIIRDLNGNCVLDSGETPLGNQTVIAEGTYDYYGNTDAQGYYTIRISNAGSYQVHPYYQGLCLLQCAGTNPVTVTFPGLGDTTNNVNFSMVPASFDLFTSNSSGNFRPGFTQTAYVYYANFGANNVNATLTYTYDADLVFVSASNNGVHNAATRTITWSLTSVAPSSNYYYYSSYMSVILQTPIGMPLGTSIINHSRITGPGAECDSANNAYTLNTFVTNSYDPNDKAVWPAGDIIEEDSMLTYTIRFQNTGTDTAWFIILKDTLSPYLEPGSVQNLASSHPITEFTISDRGILTWVFNPIYLVDSNTNEEASHGYVMFRVKKKHNLPITTAIANTAHIYFDYNEPVVTNTVTNTITLPNYIFSVESDERISVVAMPNPFSKSTQIVVEGVAGTFDFELFDVTGKVMKNISSIGDNRFDLDRENMSAGVYFYSITSTAKQRAFGKLVVE